MCFSYTFLEPSYAFIIIGPNAHKFKVAFVADAYRYTHIFIHIGIISRLHPTMETLFFICDTLGVIVFEALRIYVTVNLYKRVVQAKRCTSVSCP